MSFQYRLDIETISLLAKIDIDVLPATAKSDTELVQTDKNDASRLSYFEDRDDRSRPPLETLVVDLGGLQPSYRGAPKDLRGVVR